MMNIHEQNPSMRIHEKIDLSNVFVIYRQALNTAEFRTNRNDNFGFIAIIAQKFSARKSNRY